MKEYKNELTTEELVKRINERQRVEDTGKNAIKQESQKILIIILGSFIYAFGINFFIQPLNFYAGGFTGLAQLLTYGLSFMGFKFKNMDMTGILYYVLNIPSIFFAIRNMRKRFIVKTFIAISTFTIFVTLLPIPEVPLFNDKLGSAIVGGILSGIGIGFILRSGACDGGIDLWGMIVLNKKAGVSIGGIAGAFNILLYFVCFLLFDIPTVIYSLLYSLVVSVTCDRVHTQAINSQVMILTKQDPYKIEVEIMGCLGRGVTRIKGNGAFTGEDVNILMVYLSKHEILRLRMIVKKIDPKAFIAINHGIRVDGFFLRKLT